MAKQYGIDPDATYHLDPSAEAFDKAHKKFISEMKIFGGEVIEERYDYLHGDLNPFAIEMEQFIKSAKNVKIARTYGGECPTSKGTAVCVASIDAISGGDEEISEAIRYGQIELFCDEFESLSNDHAARMRWMRNIVQKVREERAVRKAELDALMASHRNEMDKKFKKRREELQKKLRAKSSEEKPTGVSSIIDELRLIRQMSGETY